MTHATSKPKRKTAAQKAIKRLFVAVEKSIRAADDARKARDELMALSREKGEPQ